MYYRRRKTTIYGAKRDLPVVRGAEDIPWTASHKTAGDKKLKLNVKSGRSPSVNQGFARDWCAQDHLYDEDEESESELAGFEEESWIKFGCDDISDSIFREI